MKMYNVKDKLPKNGSRVLIGKIDVALICYACAYYVDLVFYFDATAMCNHIGFDEIADVEIKDVQMWGYLPKMS